MTSIPNTIVIIGGGISGLAAAYHAQSSLPDSKIILLESSGQLGGVLETVHEGGYLIEKSADMFTTEPSTAFDLCQKLGKSDQLIETKPTPDRAFVATKNGIHPVPRGLSLMLPNDLFAIRNSPLLDTEAKRRFIHERDIPAREWTSDESLESFAVRRFGQAAFDNLFQPLVSGIYTADPKRLSMQATMARFVEMEKQHGSLIRAAEAMKPRSETATENHATQISGAQYGLFRAPSQGIGELVTWLENALTRVEVRRNGHVESITGGPQHWTIHLSEIESNKASSNKANSNNGDSIHADGVVIATPAQVSSQLLQTVDDELSRKLSGINGASSAIVVLGLDQAQLGKRDFQGYGIIVPSNLNRQVIATSFSSNKFSGRAPSGKVLVRCFIGGALQSELVDLDDDQLTQIATNELSKTVEFDGRPELARVYRWRNCMPQYHLGHLELIDEIDVLIKSHRGLELAGNSYRGVGIPVCMQSGFDAVDRLVRTFADL